MWFKPESKVGLLNEFEGGEDTFIEEFESKVSALDEFKWKDIFCEYGQHH